MKGCAEPVEATSTPRHRHPGDLEPADSGGIECAVSIGFSEFALQHGDEYTFRPEEYTTSDNVRIALAKAVPKLDWGMIWCR